ncbi:hypothetical protein B0H13DRAFT_2395176 [Mycena leptocephala]|nr:hypothetical protein B0H13DRAFT_2395176 [Mycena leptocephala]
MLKFESGWVYKNAMDEETTYQCSPLFLPSPPSKIRVKNIPSEMPSHSAPASPAPPRYTARPPLARNAGRGTTRQGAPLVSPLTPLSAGILDRTRRGSFGPEDPHLREGTILNRVQALTDELWVRHRHGEELAVRPGSVVSPQAMYTGRETRVNGEPGSINGHANVQLHAAPSNQRNWNLEVPYVSDSQIRDTLTHYGTGVHREHAVFSRIRRLIRTPRSLRDGAARLQPRLLRFLPLVNYSPVSGYVAHPEGMPPPFDISNMQELGRTMTGDHVLRFSEPSVDGSAASPAAERPGTPRLPWQLLYDRPALITNKTPVLEGVSDDDRSPDAIADDWLPADLATWPTSSCSPAAQQVKNNERVEHVPYDALFSNFVAPVESLPPAGLPEDVVKEEMRSEGEEREEGQIEEDAPPLDPCLRSRADHVAIPAIGTGRRGTVINRERYSSSPSISGAEVVHNSVHLHAESAPSPLRLPHPRSTSTTADYVSEAERLIRGAGTHLTTDNGSVFPAPPLLCSSLDPLFDIDLDNDSLPSL